MANKTLTAKVKIETKSAETSLARLEKKIKSIDKTVNKIGGKIGIEKATERAIIQQEKLKRETLKTQLAEEKLTTQKYKTEAAANKVTQATNKTTTATNRLLSTVSRLAKTYLGVMGMKAVITTSDTITSAQNRLNNIEGGSPEATDVSLDRIYSAAQRSRSGYTDMVSNVSKSMTLAGSSFQGNIDNAIKFQEIMSKAYTVGGASAAEQSSSMYQLIQALGSGVLQGDELRSVREGAPLAYKAIEEFAQGVFDTDKSLKDLASRGVITSDIVVAAIMDMESDVNAAFANTKTTFAQAWAGIKNTAIKAFEPTLEILNQILNHPATTMLIQVIGGLLSLVANVVYSLFSIFGAFFSWCSANWSWLGKVILTILSTVAIAYAVIMFPKFIAWVGYILFVIQHYIVLGAQALAAGIKAMVGWMMANWALLLIIIAIAAVVAAVIWLSDSFADACGMIVGGIMTAVAFVWNLIVGVIDGILQLIWCMVDPIIGIVEFILNCCMGGFNSFGDAVANLIGQIISWFLSLGQVVTKIIDAIFGTDWTSGLESLKDNVEEWGKNDGAITLTREAPTLNSLTDGMVDRWAYSDAYATGYDWGTTGAGWVTDTIDGFLNPSNLPNPTSDAMALGSAYDPSAINDDIANGLEKLGNIEDDTGKISDSMDLENDDLEYLRKIAETEWRNEFTTAEIRVDMTNNNTVNGDRDLDGIVEYLSEALRNEMAMVADGVHY